MPDSFRNHLFRELSLRIFTLCGCFYPAGIRGTGVAGSCNFTIVFNNLTFAFKVGMIRATRNELRQGWGEGLYMGSLPFGGRCRKKPAGVHESGIFESGLKGHPRDHVGRISTPKSATDTRLVVFAFDEKLGE